MATAPTPEEFAAVKDELAGLKDALGKAAGQTSSFGQASSQALKQLGNGVTGFAKAMSDGQQGASAFNGVINRIPQLSRPFFRSAIENSSFLFLH